MSLAFNYRHLYYFWVVAKEGGIARAAERLGIAVQTVSVQVRELERALGVALVRPAGRGIALTEAGRAALQQADAIFQLGGRLPDVVRDATGAPAVRLAVGMSDSLPKLVVRSLMEPVMAEPHLRLLCQEDRFDALLAALATHRLDAVLADRPAPPNPNLRLYSHALGASGVAWYAPPAMAARARRGFPGSLARVPVLLPTADAAIRGRIDAWFERLGVRPNLVGEFEDSALLKTFGASGMGVFPMAERVQRALHTRYGVARVGGCDGVEETWFAIGTERKVQHPLVQRLLPART
jgi:LysR family transcriptional activator of nhaA